MCRSYAYFIRYFFLYLLSVDAVANCTYIFIISFSNCLLVYIKVKLIFKILTIPPIPLLNLLISINWFTVEAFEFYTYRVTSSANSVIFSFFLIFVSSSYFSCLTLARCWTEEALMDIFVFFQLHGEKLLCFCMILIMGFM